MLYNANPHVAWNSLRITAISSSANFIFAAGKSPFNFSILYLLDKTWLNADSIFINDKFIFKIPKTALNNKLKVKVNNEEKTLNIHVNQINASLNVILQDLTPRHVLQLLRFFYEFSIDWHQVIMAMPLEKILEADLRCATYNEIETFLQLRKILPNYMSDGWKSCIDGFDSANITGWAKKADSNESQYIEIIVNGLPLKKSVMAGDFREDLLAAGVGTGKHGFRFVLDHSHLDSNVIAVALRDPVSKKFFDYHIYNSDYSNLEYDVKIEEVASLLKGWAVTPDWPDAPLNIDVYIDNAYFAAIANDKPRTDLNEKDITSGKGGFALDLPFEFLSPGNHKLRLVFHGGRYVKEIQFACPGRTPKALPDISCLNRRVSIIIPYFEDPCLEECLQRIFAHTPENIRIIIVDDCSQDAQSVELLAKYADNPLVTILHNATNLRFAGTVNAGIKAAGEDDVVILNQDVRVTPGWLRSLLLTAASSPRVATVTPMGDRAGAFSAPECGNDNPLPTHASEAEYARAFRRVSFSLKPQVPTGHGYCMYISRACLNEIGDFDSEMFSQLYGEENDFCMRALRAGWIHLIDDTAYVFHERNKSFEPGRQEQMLLGSARVKSRYPEYSIATRVFKDEPKLRLARFAGKLAAANWRELAKPRILFVIATLTGGTPQTNGDLMSYFAEIADCYLLVSDSSSISLYRLVSGELNLIYSHELAYPIDPISHISPEYDAVVAGWLHTFDIDIVHFRSLIWHSLSILPVVRALGIKIVFSFHDFYALSPNTNLIDDSGEFLGEDFIQQGSIYRCDLWAKAGIRALPLHDPVYRQHWKDRFERYLVNCDAYVTTSPEARDIILKDLPGICANKFHVIPHGRDFPAMLNLRSNYIPGERIRILVPGNIGPHKGKGIIENLAVYDGKHLDILQFHILGHSSGPKAGIKRHGAYKREELAQQVAEIRPHIAVIFSIWCETWCHTLTELWSMGIPAIVFDFGTLARRVRDSGGGWVIPYGDVPEVYEHLVSIATNLEEQKRAETAVAIWQAGEGQTQTVGMMGAAYYELYHNLLNGDGTRKMPFIAISSRAGIGSSHLRVLDPARNDFKRQVNYLPVEGGQLLALLRAKAIDCAIIQRAWLGKFLAAECLSAAKRNNIPLIFEIDDDLLTVPDEKLGFQKKSPYVKDLIEQATMITVATRELLNRLMCQSRHAHLRESRLAADRWPAKPVKRNADGQIRAMYYGTPGHVDDLRMILPALTEIHKKYPFFRLALIRLGENMEDDLAGCEFIERYDIPRESRPLPDFIKAVAPLIAKMDFGIAPLRDTHFNRAKSFIKVIEYGALGLTSIASRVTPYVNAGELPHLSLAENTLDGWIIALEDKILLGSLNRAYGLETMCYVQRGFMHNAAAATEFDDVIMTALRCHPGRPALWRMR